MKTRSVKMKHFQSGGEFRAKWPSPNERLSLHCALKYMVTQVNSLACWETITNCTRAGLVYLSGFHCHITDSKQVRQVTEVNEKLKVYALPRKYYVFILLITVPVPEIMLILFIYLFIYVFLDYLVLVGKHKKQKNFGNQSVEQMIRLSGFQRDKCQLCVNWFKIWSSCGLLKTR